MFGGKRWTLPICNGRTWYQGVWIAQQALQHKRVLPDGSTPELSTRPTIIPCPAIMPCPSWCPGTQHALHSFHITSPANQVLALPGSHRRAHWLHLELVFCGWRKLTAAAKRQHLTPSEPAADHAGPTDTATNDAACTETVSTQLQPAHSNGTLDSHTSQQPGVVHTCDECQESAEPAELSPDDAAAGCPSETSNANDCGTFQALPDGPTVAASLADYPAGHPWRPLLLRKAVMAQQGLRRLTGLRLGRAVRDLRELEGSYIVKDNDK